MVPQSNIEPLAISAMIHPDWICLVDCLRIANWSTRLKSMETQNAGIYIRVLSKCIHFIYLLGCKNTRWAAIWNPPDAKDQVLSLIPHELLVAPGHWLIVLYWNK